MLNALRHTAEIEWCDTRDHSDLGRNLSDCTIGIIGCGRIGQAVIDRLFPFECPILINDINRKVVKQTVSDKNDIKFAPLNALFAKSDIITIHIPLRDQSIDNTNLITHKLLSLAKQDAIIVNTSRANIINETDLNKWLDYDRIAVIDVLSKDEQVAHTLVDRCDTLVTPHIAGFTKQARYAMEKQAIKNLMEALL
jgi:lactate dehydrogenase-like 2-hydroxyacid dehydrogenase